ncbi:vang-like protein 2 isoform X2 [Adelges cooleyi]|uniref:vang-like protein 2 isoform X2 n=1 Tax=Adelges cooleyi TaxID=133065 RepID=UPI00217F8BCD|nr:vang-like protein 2 isoform X2 [Adelges cooleyi]
MDTESLRSLHSEHSIKSKYKTHSLKSGNNHRNSTKIGRKYSDSLINPYDTTMAPYQTTVMLEDTRDGQDVVEVQILPQDENWGENTTAITGNTSIQSGSMEEMGALWPDTEQKIGFPILCHRYIATALTGILSTVAFLSPLAMLVLPKLGVFSPAVTNLSPQQRETLLNCGAECKGVLVSLAFKMFLLALAAWAIFLRPMRATMPRIYVFRAAVLALVSICCVAFWLFYVVQVTEGVRATATGEDLLEYRALVSYASSLCDCLLCIHYVAIVLMEIRHLQPSYYIKVVRSPDGECRTYSIGQLSIQRAAVWVLERYYTEFSIYNPYLERLPVSKSKKNSSSFKFYDIEGIANNTLQINHARGTMNGHPRRRDSSHNERFYEEHDYERRVKKRRARLMTAAEEAFTHVKRSHHDPGGGSAMDPYEAAQAVFPTIARSLQKYLRVTRQQPRHTVESILSHLALCLTHDASPKAFLEPYLSAAPVLQNEKEQKSVQSWSLICNELLTRALNDGTVFQLRQNDLSLLCTVHTLPHFSITEEVINPKSNRFVLRLNSETSV